ncbi:TonB-dependent receptor (plasmid) [Photobacterium damselae subsp. damselae]|uniref:TonB-dependent siderophore receptor n=1 Tax=Photobacterium damselae TaxID=38293 RepID=UPI000A2FAFEB|nr:TonB-dependent receptor [Photobacterium damselae]ARR51692.1 TonB-dependent siderophore receptor [Photobacterium damselae subsp. damselae]QAY37562.1 TonB-dependent receptor [Photobacterium damselae subsp. damselae]
MKIKLISAAITSAILASPTFADDATEFTTVVVKAERPDYKANETSTATMMDVSELETPRQINTIDKKLLDDLQATSLEKALQNDPSTIKTHESDGHENFYIRGFQLTTNEGYLRNGERKYSLIQEPVEMYERIEILKGSQGLLYGMNGHGGVVNMVTKTPKATSETSLSQDIGSNNFYRSVVDTTGAINNDARYRVIASKQTKDNWRHYKDGTHPKTERDLIAIMLDYDLSDSTMLSLSFDHKTQKGHQDSGAYFDDNGNIIGNRDLILDMPWAVNDKKEDSYGIKLTHMINDNWEASASYHYLDMANTAKTSSIRLNKDSAKTGDYTYTTGQRNNSYDVHTAMVNVNGEFDTAGINHQMLIGANLVDHTYHRSSRWGGKKSDASIDPTKPTQGFNPDNMGKPSSNDYPRQTYGLYVQDLITLNDNWQILAGLRYDQFHQNRTTNDKKDGTGHNRVYRNVIPNASLMFHPNQDSTIYATYSQSFEPKSPIDSERDANDGMERDPELGHLYELGYKQEFMDNRAIFETSLFQITKENISVTSKYSDPNNPNITKITEQGGKEIHTGIDAALTGRITDKLTVKAGAQYMKAEYKGQPKHDGKVPADIPRFTANSWANYELTDRIDLNAGIYYVGSRYGNDDNNQKKKAGYTLVDTGAIYRMPLENDKELSFRFKVNNLLNAEYETSGDYTGMGIGQGRNYMLSAQYKF